MYNGTCLAVKKLFQDTFETTVPNAIGPKEYVLIPIIPVDQPFRFIRLEFPMMLRFPITINKVQGQSFKITEFKLTFLCFFFHVLLCFSQIVSRNNLFILALSRKTTNAAYTEAYKHKASYQLLCLGHQYILSLTLTFQV